MKRIFIGVDVSKKSLDIAVCEADHKAMFLKKISNTPKSILSLLRSLKNKYEAEGLWFCFEHTGNYGLLLASCIQAEDLSYSMVCSLQIKKSLGLVRGKNDIVDAKRIAEYASVHRHKLSATELPSTILLKIRSLLTYRKQMVKIRSQLKNSLKSMQLLELHLRDEEISTRIQSQIKVYDTEVAQIERQIKAYIEESEELAENYANATSVTGIGLITAASMLVYTSNFTSFTEARKFNCFAGFAPFEHSSGKSIRGKTKTSSYRNKNIKTLLHNGVNSAINYDPQLKAYYKRKLEEGKHKNVVKNNIACKLVSRVFACVKRQSPYVTLAY
jgi:transposase